MARRIYFESVKKWAIGAGVSAAGAIVLIFMYLQATGGITILEYSGDSTCAGTPDDPCMAIVTFVPSEDLFIYPTDYDPWSRNTPFEFDPAVSSWRFFRKWGRGWREVDLTKSCAGTWCGAPPGGGKYSIVFREGRKYTVKIEALKDDIRQTIKWGFGDVDPYWYGKRTMLMSETSSPGYLSLKATGFFRLRMPIQE